MPHPFCRPINANQPIHWVLDWDGTLTTHDTLDTLITICQESRNDPSISSKWSQITKAYLDDYTSTLSTLAPNGNLPTTVPEERKLLQKLRDIEERSIRRVIDSGIFAGLEEGDLRIGGVEAVKNNTIQLRKGATSFLEQIFHCAGKQNTVTDIFQILSVNWSQNFIAGALEASVQLPFHRPTYSDFLQQQTQKYAIPKSNENMRFDIYANELSSISHSPTTSFTLLPSPSPSALPPHHTLLSSPDKLHYLQSLQKLNPQTQQCIPTIYIGDSWTDLECLLAADLGICMRDEPMSSAQKQLKDALERLGIECRHIGDEGGEEGGKKGEGGVLWARDFGEVGEWVGGWESSKLSGNG